MIDALRSGADKGGAMKNLKLTTKMLLLVLIPVLAILLISTTSILVIGTVMQVSEAYLYNTSYVATDLMLNADRDFYQALVAANQMANIQSTQEEKQAGADNFCH